MQESARTISYILRIGIAFSFVYPAIDSFLHPGVWINFLPTWVIDISPVDAIIMLAMLSVVELVVATLILLMKDPTWPARIAIIILASILILDFSVFDVVFRDLAILLMAVALIVLHRKPSKT